MADYFGVVAISRRLSITPMTLRRWKQQQNFLMYQRWHKPVRRMVWYTNDMLILSWERERCSTQTLPPGPARQTRKSDVG